MILCMKSTRVPLVLLTMSLEWLMIFEHVGLSLKGWMCSLLCYNWDRSNKFVAWPELALDIKTVHCLGFRLLTRHQKNPKTDRMAGHLPFNVASAFTPANVRGEPVFSVMAAGWFCGKSGWIGKVEDVKPVLLKNKNGFQPATILRRRVIYPDELWNRWISSALVHLGPDIIWFYSLGNMSVVGL